MMGKNDFYFGRKIGLIVLRPFLIPDVYWQGIEKICASIKGHQWSIVYVKIVSDKSLDKMDMCKKQYFCLRQNQALLIIWRPSPIKVNLHQYGGRSILGCTPVRTKKEQLMWCILVLMTLFQINLNCVTMSHALWMCWIRHFVSNMELLSIIVMIYFNH